MATGYVYGLLCDHCNDTEYRYIGITTASLSKRLANHRYYARIGDNPVNRWMAKHGQDNIRMVVIEEPDISIIKEREIELIAEARENCIKPLLNVTGGGDGCYNPTEESRKKRSDRLKGVGFFEGRTHTDESKAKMREAHLDYKWTDETRAKFENTIATREKPIITEESRAKRIAATKGIANRGVCSRWHESRDIVHPTCEHWCAKQRANGVPIAARYLEKIDV